MTKSEEKELAKLNELIDFLLKNKNTVTRISVTKEQHKILNGRPYRGFEIYVPGEKK